MNEQLVLFEGQEKIKVRTDQGETLINLANTGKICGVTRKDKSKNTERVRWTGSGGISEKLTKIRENLVISMGGVNPPQENYNKYIEEIDYVLDEIDNGDDRNSIFMSSWMSKRLAMNCGSQKAEQYKNFLATLDEKYSNGELRVSNEQVAQLISTTVQGIVPIMVTEITKQFAPMLGDSKKQVDTMVGLMHDQAVIYEEERQELKNLIGFRSVNTSKIINGVKEKLSDKVGYNVMANNPMFQKVKKAIFKEYDVIKWEDISVSNYSSVFAFADEYISDLKIAN